MKFLNNEKTINRAEFIAREFTKFAKAQGVRYFVVFRDGDVEGLMIDICKEFSQSDDIKRHGLPCQINYLGINYRIRGILLISKTKNETTGRYDFNIEINYGYGVLTDGDMFTCNDDETNTLFKYSIILNSNNIKDIKYYEYFKLYMEQIPYRYYIHILGELPRMTDKSLLEVIKWRRD